MKKENLSIPFFPDTEDIKKSTSALTKMIRSTEDYKRYQKCLSVLKEQEKLYHKFIDFRKKNLLVQIEQESEQHFDRVEALHTEYKDVLTEPVVVDFLSAEQRMCSLMRVVYDCIAEEVNLDYSYMNDL